jgi:P4 family phage/plasmid primase-like protien
MRAKAGELPKQIYAEGNLHLHDSEWFAKWSRISQKERTINASLSLLSSNFQEIRLPIRLVDSDPFLVGFDNARQVIDLKTGEARPAKPEDLVTKSLQVYDLGDSKKAVRWTSFLEQIFENDQELIQWLKRWCGYLLTGSTREQVFMFCYGLGDNGKSVFAKLLSYIMGDYARTVASEALTESKRAAGAASPDIITLIGARLALSSESVAEAALNEAQIKLMTGGDTMSARDLYTGICEFDPNFKLMMLGNHKPIIRGNDHGIWRRVRLIPFNRTFTESEKDLSLVDKLKLEAPHILAWMVEGCIDWQKVGLSGVPKKVGNATKDYRTEQDVIGEWLTDNCEFGEGKEATATALYNCYKTWALENGLRPVSNVTLGRRLAERGGLEKKRSNSGSIWSGIGITDVKDTLHLDWDNTNNIDSII